MEKSIIMRGLHMPVRGEEKDRGSLGASIYQCPMAVGDQAPQPGTMVREGRPSGNAAS